MNMTLYPCICMINSILNIGKNAVETVVISATDHLLEVMWEYFLMMVSKNRAMMVTRHIKRVVSTHVQCTAKKTQCSLDSTIIVRSGAECGKHRSNKRSHLHGSSTVRWTMAAPGVLLLLFHKQSLLLPPAVFTMLEHQREHKLHDALQLKHLLWWSTAVYICVCVWYTVCKICRVTSTCIWTVIVKTKQE